MCAGLLLHAPVLSFAASKEMPRITVAVAANAVPVITRLADDFEKSSETRVIISSGATGLLARQAREGAPFDLFISADLATVRKLSVDGVITSASVATYALGRLYLIESQQAEPQITRIEDLKTPEASKLKIAIANPEIAPYGLAAQQALERSGITPASLSDRLRIGEDVRQTLQYVDTGNADVGIVPASLIADHLRQAHEVPRSLYEPIVQALGVITKSKNRAAAEAFRSYLLSDRAATVFNDFGYGIPEGWNHSP
jgi:molybdate transport system substrate-binding protein